MANENFDNIAWKEYILKGEEIFDNLKLKRFIFCSEEKSGEKKLL